MATTPSRRAGIAKLSSRHFHQSLLARKRKTNCILCIVASEILHQILWICKLLNTYRVHRCVSFLRHFHFFPFWSIHERIMKDTGYILIPLFDISSLFNPFFICYKDLKSLQLLKLTHSRSSCDQLPQSLETDASHNASEERTSHIS